MGHLDRDFVVALRVSDYLRCRIEVQTIMFTEPDGMPQICLFLFVVHFCRVWDHRVGGD